MLHHILTHLYVYDRTGYTVSWRNLIFSKQQGASRHRAEGWGCLNFGGILKHLLHNRSYYYNSKINNKVSFGSENIKFLVYFKGQLLRSILFLAPKLFPTPRRRRCAISVPILNFKGLVDRPTLLLLFW